MKINAIYEIQNEPKIWAGTGAKNWHNLQNATGSKAFLLAHPMWEFSWSSLFLYWKQKKLLRKNNIKLILLNNSISEHRFAKMFGFKSYLINQNIHCNEHSFKIDSSRKKEYDAVYIAAAKKYKRLNLASKIKNLFVITYFWPDVKNENGEWDLHSFEPKVKHAKYNKFRIEAEEINQILNKSRCGLALSKKEGAMWAVMEYLMSGLPVVTTSSKGGRNFFFTNKNSILVEDNPQSVQNGVAEIIRKQFDPNDVRKETLNLIEPYRQKYISLLLDLSENEFTVASREDLYHKIWGNNKGISNIRII